MTAELGEYGFDPWYFRSMLESDTIELKRADAARFAVEQRMSHGLFVA